FAVLFANVEDLRRAEPFVGTVVAPPDDAARRRQLDDLHHGRRLLTAEPELDLATFGRGAADVPRPPGCDAFRGGDGVVHGAGRGVDRYSVPDVGHGCSSGRCATDDCTSRRDVQPMVAENPRGDCAPYAAQVTTMSSSSRPRPRIAS